MKLTEIADNVSPDTIVVFTKPSCQQCKATERWLDKRGIDYTLGDAEAPEVIAAAKVEGITSAPVVVSADGTALWGGFNPAMLAEHA